MQVAVHQGFNTDSPTWVTVAGDAPTVIGHLTQGQNVGPLRVPRGKSDAFHSADWLFTGIETSAGEIDGLLAHPFTAAHAGLAYVGQLGDGKTHCLLGFPLSATVTTEAEYQALLWGLTTVYRATYPKSMATWRKRGDGAGIALEGVLDSLAVERLMALGHEYRDHGYKQKYRHKRDDGGIRSDGFVRSKVRLERMQIVRRVGGSEASLLTLEQGERVFCPIHADLEGVATVIGHGANKGVQCPCCVRNFWMMGVRQDMTPTFRDVVRQLYDAETKELAQAGGALPAARQYEVLHEQYLPSLNFFKGMTFVHSPKGTGKTEALKSLVQHCKANNLSVVLVGHRRSLLRAQSERLGLDLYFEMQIGTDGSSEFRAVQATNGYAISLDSLPTRLRPNVHKFDVVIVDEAEQVVRHLMGGTLKRQRRLAHRTFQHYVSVAKAVYFLDADLDRLGLNFAFEAAEANTATRFIVNEPPITLQEYDLVTTREGIAAQLARALQENKKCYVACNSKNRAIEISMWIAKHWPMKRVQVVHSKNAQEVAVQEVLSDIVGEYLGESGKQALDVLVGSPTIGTGIDITFPSNAKVVDCVFGIFETGINTHYDIDQQLSRVRHPGHVAVWINRNVQHYETSAEAIVSELRSTVLRTDLEIGFERSGEPIYAESDRMIVQLYSEIVAAERQSKNALFDHWVELRRQNGWVGLLDVTSDEDKDVGKAALVEGGELRYQAEVKRIMESAEIDDEKAASLKEIDQVGGALTEAERASLDKWRLKDFYAKDVDEPLIAFDDDEKTRRKVTLMEVMIGEADFNRAVDLRETGVIKDSEETTTSEVGEQATQAKHLGLSVIVFDRQFRCAKAQMLSRLLSAAGLLDLETGHFDVTSMVGTDNLDAFVTSYKQHRARIESELGVDMRRDIARKPVQQLGDVLELIGGRVQLCATKKVNGAKKRYYQIDADRLEAILEVVVRRAAKRREEWIAEQEERRGDNVPEYDVYNNGRALSPDDEGCEEDPNDERGERHNVRAKSSATQELQQKITAWKAGKSFKGEATPSQKQIQQAPKEKLGMTTEQWERIQNLPGVFSI